ncbi:Ribosome biogenesis protein nsa1 (NOP7-associated protein 1) [Coemansia nantahalensis]|uniref:Ribosome biogenesis protein nsa1 (NOP7-associated protein 1) n=1 Tax=Coemansia nantahalensis TaxID=2789366 RepID=A0ACC1JS86_9FUNG|nr:Ribosome biogenesis protein nsa1 (NOP7-associated protein 1) [Coemansia nantahalensis]
MRFYTGDEAGLIKAVDIDHNVTLLEAQAQAAKKARAEAKAKTLEKKGDTTPAGPTELAGVEVRTVSGTVSRSLGIQQMCTAAWTSGEAAFVVARKGGVVEAIARDSGASLARWAEPGFADALSIKHNGKVIAGRHYVGVGAADGRFLACTNLGEVRYQAFTSDDGAAAAATLLKLPMDACRMRTHSARPSVFAVGGREQELTVWDAETVEAGADEYAKARSAPLFRSKNVANDNLDLRVPVWITDVQFLDDNASAPSLAVSTGYRQIRIYDARAQPRPVHDWTPSKHPIYHILASHARPELYFADNVGNLSQLDLRTGKVIGGYKGIAGAVKSIALSEDGTKVAAAGLDRYLRVYEAGGMRRPLHRAYVKQRVAHVVWDWEQRDLAPDEIEQQEAEAIWDGMDRLEQDAPPRLRPHKRKAAAQ